jgi:hypothetical protein
MMDDMVEPPRPARTYKKRGLVKTLGKNPPTAMRNLTDEPPRVYPEAYLPAGTG